MEIYENGKIGIDTLLSPIIPYMQAWLFYITIGVNTCGLLPGKSWWIVVAQLIVLFPTVYVFSLLLTDSAPIYIILVLLCSVIMNSHDSSRFIYLLVLVSLCVGIRVNSLVLMFFIVAIFVGIAIGVILPSVLLPSNHNASVLGMVWEMTGICKQYLSDDLKEEMSNQSALSCLHYFGK